MFMVMNAGNKVIVWGRLQRRGAAGGCGHRPERPPLQSRPRSQLLTAEKKSPICGDGGRREV